MVVVVVASAMVVAVISGGGANYGDLNGIVIYFCGRYILTNQELRTVCTCEDT